MIAAQMHRLAARLGVRDGEAYTIVCGLVLALLLAGIGLPGVFRGFDAAIDQAAAAPPPASTPTSVVGDAAPPSSEVVTPSLPALAPRPSAAPPVSAGLGEPPGPATTTPPPSSSADRSPGELTVLADIPDPGSPDAVAVGPDGTIYVASDDTGDQPSMLWAFDATGDRTGSWPAPGQPQDRTRGLTGVAVDPDGDVWVVDAATARVLRLDRDRDELVAVALVEDIPACGVLALESPCESGLLDSPPLPTGIATSPGGTVVVADRAQGVLWRLAGSELRVLTVVDDRVPGDGPVGLSFASDDELIVAVGGRMSSFPPGLPAVVQIRLTDGGTEPPVLVAELAVTEAPADVVVGRSGRAYVSIPSAGVVADIGIDQGDRIDISGGDTRPSFSTPTGLALRARSLLISDRGDRLFDLAVNDRPVT